MKSKDKTLSKRHIKPVFLDQLLAAAGHEALSFRQYDEDFAQDMAVTDHVRKTNEFTLFPKLMILYERRRNRAYSLRTEHGVWWLRSTEGGKWTEMRYQFPRSDDIEQIYRSYLERIILDSERDPTGAHARQQP